MNLPSAPDSRPITLKRDRRRMLIAPACLVLSLPFVLVGANRADCNTTGLTQWLPDNDPHRETYDWFRLNFRSDESVIVTWAGCTLASPILSQFATALENRSGTGLPVTERRLFDQVITGDSVIDRLTSPPLRLPRSEAIRRLRGVMIGPAETVERPEVPDATPVPSNAASDTESSQQWPTCVVISLTPSGLAAQRDVIRVIRQVAWDTAGIKPSDLKIGGRVYEAATMDEKSEQSLRDYVLPITVVSLVIAWFCLRNIRALIAITIVASYCRLLTLALIYAAGGHLSSVLIISPLLIYVLSVSGSLHLANHYFLAPPEQSRTESAGQALAAVWKPCVLATVTSALGLFSLSVCRISPIRSFGYFSTAALLLALPVILSCLPGALTFAAPQSAPAPNSASGRRRPFEEFLSILAGFLLAKPFQLAIGILAVVFVIGLGLTRLDTTINFNQMFSPNSEINRNYEWIEQHIGPLGSVEALLFFPDDSQLRLFDRLRLAEEIERAVRRIPEVQGTFSAATFSPTETRGSAPGRILQLAMIRRRLPEILRAENLLADDSSGEQWRIHLRIPALRDNDYSETISAVRRQISQVLTAFPHADSKIGLQLTGLVSMIDVAQETLLQDLFRSYLCAFLMIFAVMVVTLRSIRAGLVAMASNVAPTALVFGTMGWLGLKVDVASVLTASVALGVALDDTLHFLSWFRAGLQDGRSRNSAVRYALQRCGPAMIQTTLVCGLGLLVLAHSDFIPTRRFALLQTLLLFAALFGDMVLLPAMLASRLGRVFSSRMPATGE